MCFSTSASFGASAILAVAGIVSLKKAEKPSQLLFALVPVIFSIQQFTEGFVWIALNNHYEDWKNIPIYSFLFIAQVLWPLWVPLSVLLIEENEDHKKVLMLFVCFGAALALYLAYCLLFYKIDAVITPYHIHYELYFPKEYNSVVGVIYFMTTIIPPFISTQKKMTLLGVFNFLSFIITEIFFDDYLVSVWYFFSALISWQVFLVMKNMNQPHAGKLRTSL
jgi:hypothetical protein